MVIYGRALQAPLDPPPRLPVLRVKVQVSPERPSAFQRAINMSLGIYGIILLMVIGGAVLVAAVLALVIGGFDEF